MMVQRKVTDKLRLKIMRDYEATHSIEKAAKRSGVGKFLATRVLRESGVTLDGLQRHYRHVRKLPDYRALKIEYESGASLSQLAAKYGATVRTVSEALYKVKAKMRGQGGRFKILTDDEREQIPRLYAELGTQAAVATHLQTSQSRVSKHLRALGIVSTKRPSGERHGSWKGGRSQHASGYICVMVSRDDPMCTMANKGTGYVMEHRLVMARHLGRALTRKETVHHINGNRSDNRLENLQLRSGHHGAGVAHRCRDCGSTNIESTRLHS